MAQKNNPNHKKSVSSNVLEWTATEPPSYDQWCHLPCRLSSAAPCPGRSCRCPWKHRLVSPAQWRPLSPFARVSSSTHCQKGIYKAADRKTCQGKRDQFDSSEGYEFFRLVITLPFFHYFAFSDIIRSTNTRGVSFCYPFAFAF